MLTTFISVTFGTSEVFVLKLPLIIVFTSFQWVIECKTVIPVIVQAYFLADLIECIYNIQTINFRQNLPEIDIYGN